MGNQFVEAASQEEVQDMSATKGTEEKNTPQTDQHAVLMYEKRHCPHHPCERRVRFDPTGQAWCDHLNCWDCYWLIKIGEAMRYPCLIDRGGEQVIQHGQEAWSRFVRTQRAFLVMVVTEEAIIVYHRRCIGIPDVSGEISQVKTPYVATPAW